MIKLYIRCWLCLIHIQSSMILGGGDPKEKAASWPMFTDGALKGHWPDQALRLRMRPAENFSRMPVQSTCLKRLHPSDRDPHFLLRDTLAEQQIRAS